MKKKQNGKGRWLQIILLLLVINCTEANGQDEFSAGFEKITLGNTVVVFETQCARELPGVRFIHVHENEQTAVQAALAMLAKYQRGCFASWQSYGDRYVNFMIDTTMYKFDPNRIYTAKGRNATLMANGAYSQEADSMVAVAANLFLAEHVDSQRLVVAFHNNTDKGGLSINSYRKHGDYAADAKKVFVNRESDADDFFLTTDDRIFRYIKSMGYNIILQNNDKVTDDGSLSVYAGNHHIPYLNIEAEHGHLQQQIEMTDVVQQMISDLYLNP